MAAEAILKIKVLMDAASATKGLDEQSSKASKWGKGIKVAGVAAAGVLTGMAAAGMKAAQAAAEDAQGQALLAKAMQNSAGASKESIAATEDWISKTAAATGVADDQLRPALGTLVRATGDVAESQKAMQLALDISAATGKDLTSVSEAMAKGYAGNTGALGRLVPGIDKTVLASKDMNKVMAELARTTGGSAAASAETAEGKMKRFHLALDETQEGIGGALLPILDKLSGVLLKVASWAQNNTGVFVVLAAAIGTIALAVLAVNAALKVYQATMIVVQVVQKATWLSNPIFLVVAAVILLVGAVVLLWKRSSTFRNFVLGMWSAIRAAATATWTVIRVIGTAVFRALTAYVNVWRALTSAAFNIVKAVASAAFNVIRAAVSRVSGAVSSLIGWVRGIRVPGAIAAAFNTIKSAVGHVIDAVSSLIGWLKRITVPSLSGGTFDAIGSAIDRLIGKIRSLIGWLKSIKVPKISIPGVGGRSAAPAGVASIATARGLSASPVALASSTRSAGGVTIVVQGALDPEGVARQIKRILGAHGQRVGLTTVGGGAAVI